MRRNSENNRRTLQVENANRAAAMYVGVKIKNMTVVRTETVPVGVNGAVPL